MLQQWYLTLQYIVGLPFSKQVMHDSLHSNFVRLKNLTYLRYLNELHS